MLERRPAADTDEEFLRALYATTRPDLELWEDGREAFLDLQFRAQQRDWASRFPESDHDLILLDGAPVGRLWLAWLPAECRIVDLTLLPERRRAGIGTRVAGDVLAEAERRNLSVALAVERRNEPALTFWARLGFSAVGGDPVYALLERPVSRPAPRPAPR
jgi:GNAT superfamily N-acetyltransferase